MQLAVGMPTGVAAMWLLLTLFLMGGVRFVAHLAFEGRSARLPRHARARATC